MKSCMYGDFNYPDRLFDGVARSSVKKKRRDAAGLFGEVVLDLCVGADSSISSVCRVAPKQRVLEIQGQ
jgi:hypothetical protein